MNQVRVPNFEPTTSGLHFENYYPHEPTITVKLPTGQTLGIGDAANGLCGGMAFTVRDYFEADRPIPADTQAPTAGTPLYQFIVKRLLDSFNLPLGIGRYLELMQPAYPDVSLGFGLPGRASVMLNTEWPRIKQDLDAGHPVPLGLVKVKSSAVQDLGKNHQVLTYGYDLDDTDLTLWLYDPNYPDRDDVCMRLSIASTRIPVGVTYIPSSETVICFFHTPYTAQVPPPA